ncbi:hypothetical protein [Amycolatopsis suaedae]|uniref:Uncharacterized protein n=1 Tax=Amycolatopsis suaedae TaxID=2510978 RepID=A0A4V2EL41_9PSEU|nr:hypothetical protein [Amycolatopsis suaedae]RZQ60245.1 hypothetical protein EWH70_30130 [Amycolatopsis suaedae]
MDPAQVRDFAVYLGAEARLTLPVIERFVVDEGLNKHGFNSDDKRTLLSPIGDLCDTARNAVVTPVFEEMRRKLCELGDRLLDAARAVQGADADHRTVLERTEKWWRGEYEKYLSPASVVGKPPEVIKPPEKEPKDGNPRDRKERK